MVLQSNFGHADPFLLVAHDGANQRLLQKSVWNKNLDYYMYT